jgi:competence protein ComEA
MQNIQKKTIYYFLLTFVISFTLGLLFDHYILHRSFDIKQNSTEEADISVKSEQTKKVTDRVVQTEQGCTIYVDVAGSVRTPGVYCLESGALIVDAVNKAGGFSKDSATKFIARRINLAQPLVENQKLYFPFETELICELQSLVDESKKIENMMNTPVTQLPTTEPYVDTVQNTTPQSSNTANDSTNSDGVECVNINTATKEQLITLNGVGESTAEKIIQGRPYVVKEDLLNVAGIGEATLGKFINEICI